MNGSIKVCSILFWASFVTSTVTLSAQPLAATVLWTYNAGTTIVSTPTLASDGTVILGTYGGVCAVTNNGSIASNKWNFVTGTTGGNSTAVIGADGTIYVGSGDLHLYAISPSGIQAWAFPFRSIAPTSPALGSDGAIYVEADGILYALTPKGAQTWAYTNYGSGFPNCPTIASDGTIYMGANGSTLWATAPDGSLRWSWSLPRPINNTDMGDSPAIGRDGSIYATCNDLLAFSPAGTNVWSTSAGSFIGSPAIGADGTIYVANYGTMSLSAIRPGGQVAWTVLSGTGYRPPATTPAIDAAGMIYYCVSNGLWAVTPNGQVAWTVTAPGDPGVGGEFATTSPIIGPDGTIYAALGNILYAVASGTNGPTNSPWPMYRQNVRHTGRVEKPSLAAPQKRSDNNFQLQMYPQQLGLTYTIESSTNLNTWTSLTSFVATSLPMPFVDLSASNSPMKFYRAFSGP